MSDSQTPTTSGELDEAWELIPWYVNGSLSEGEVERIERLGEKHPELAAEIDRQAALAVGVCELDVPSTTDDAGKSWDALRSRIEAENAARAPIVEARPWWAGWVPSFQNGLALAGVSCAAMIVALVALGPEQELVDDGFRTLTTAPESEGAVIKFQSAADLEQSVVAEIVARYNLKLIGEPTSPGVYRALAADGTDLDAAAATLMADPGIVFAAPE